MTDPASAESSVADRAFITDAHTTRDRATRYAYLAMFAYVWGLYGMGPALLIIRHETGMSRTVASLHSTATAIGFLIIGTFGPRITARLGRIRTVRLGTAGIGIGIALVAFGGTAMISIPGAMCIGLGGSMALNGLNAFLAMHHGSRGAAIIGEGAGVSMLAGLLSPLAIGAFIDWGIDWRFAMALAVVALVVADRTRGDDRVFDVGYRTPSTEHGALPASYWWAWTAAALCIGVEFSFVMWAGDVLRSQSDASTSLAAASLTAVAAGMATGRFLIGPMLRRMRLETLFRASLTLPLVAWFPMWFGSSSVLILLAMVTIGVGLGFHYPLSLSRMVAASGGHADLANARSSLASGIAIAIAPLALGALADALGLHAAFVAVPTMLAAALLIAVTRPVTP